MGALAWKIPSQSSESQLEAVSRPVGARRCHAFLEQAMVAIMQANLRV